MNALILTDYKTIEKSLNICYQFALKANDIVANIIVDNSDEHLGYKYILQKKLTFQKETFLKKDVYVFKYCGLDLVLIDNNCNAGYAKGNNLGASYAKKYYESQYYIFSNNDLDFLEEIDLKSIEVLFKKYDEIGIIGTNVLYKGLSRQNPRINRSIISQMILGDFNNRFHCKFNRYLNSLDQNPKEGKTGWVTGCFIIVNAEKFSEIGGFDEKTFLYAEEMIISKKMEKKGYITYYYPKITIIHNHQGVDSRKMRVILHNSMKYYYREYEKVNVGLIIGADISFLITEVGYFIYHDIFKRGIINIIHKLNLI